jgi:histidine ammonia-lyase
MSQPALTIDRNPLTFRQVCECILYKHKLDVAEESIDDIRKCREYLTNKLANSDSYFYGINTGFGYLQNVKIDKSQLTELQDNLLKSHACGMGELVPIEIVRLMIALKIKSLSYGNSGVSVEVVERLKDMYNNDIIPVVYTQGSLGASGDLAPLSHMCLPLIGYGEVYFKGQLRKAEDVLVEMNWKPIELQSKEGLALINGTQFMSGYGLYILAKLNRLIRWADTIAALSFDGFDSCTDCLNEKIHAVRGHKGQIDTAAALRELLDGSEIAGQPKATAQDPYSFRCIPQVHGATKDTFDHVLKVFMTEANAVTDNPNVFPDEDLIVSGGNFHGQPLALCLDFIAIAAAELGSISERRTYQLLSGQRGLPLFLINNPGLHSGLMIAQYTAAGIVSENKQLCTPASVDTIPSSNNQEDHVSMGANAATKCYRVIQNIEKVLAIELITAAQALSFRKPLNTSPTLDKVLTAFRTSVPFNDADRVLHHDMIKAVEFVNNYRLDG